VLNSYQHPTYWRLSISIMCLIVAISSSQLAESRERELYEKALNNYERLIQQAVKNGLVDYALLKKNQHFIEHLLYALSVVPINQLQKNEQLALYINAYNVFTLRLVLDYWPRIKSIKDIPEYPLSRRWKDQRWQLGNKRISLRDLKLNYLRGFKNPMVHLALSCAALSCPDLYSGVFRASTLNRQLVAVTRSFLSQNKGLQWQMESRLVGEPEPVVYLSKIFKREETDFVINGYSLLGFAEEFSPPEFRDFLLENKNNVQVKFMSFDWSLNKQ